MRMMDTFGDSVSIRRQVLDGNQLQKLALTLGRTSMAGQDVSADPPPIGTPIPPGYHLVYFTPVGTESELGADGTDRTFNAPAPFTRRMWAGGHMAWPGELRVGDEVEEHTRLVSATPKKSRSAGEMVLVEVEKEFRGPRGTGVLDRRSWVFRPELHATTTKRAEVDVLRAVSTASDSNESGESKWHSPGSWPLRHLCWSPVALFRFSALTFNGHKIHYDPAWSSAVEGHAGIVVHGPLNLISMLDYWRDVHGKDPQSITYRAVAPVYAGDEYVIKTIGNDEGKAWEVVAEKKGTVCMKADIEV